MLGTQKPNTKVSGTVVVDSNILYIYTVVNPIAAFLGVFSPSLALP